MNKPTFAQFLVEEELYELALPKGYQLKKTGKTEITVGSATKRVNEYAAKKDGVTIGYIIPHASSKTKRKGSQINIDFTRSEVRWGYIFDHRFQPTEKIPPHERRGFISAKEALKHLAHRYERSQAN